MRKVSIIPRGQALGVTLSAPDDDRFNYSEHYLRGKIRVALGGRVAEELVYGDTTTGAESDIQQVTEDRPRHGRPLGHERRGRLRHSAPPRPGLLLPGVEPASGPRRNWWTPRSAASSRGARSDAPLLTEHRDKLEALAEALLETRDARPGRRLRGRRLPARPRAGCHDLVARRSRVRIPPTLRPYGRPRGPSRPFASLKALDTAPSVVFWPALRSSSTLRWKAL